MTATLHQAADVEFTLAEQCVVACAEVWRDAGEVLAGASGIIPTLAARLAAATFAPDLLVTDGGALLVRGPLPLGGRPGGAAHVEGWLPFSQVFDIAWSGRRHALMGAAQIDAHGNTNISCIGPWERPATQLVGVRGAPGNTVNHPTSYWIPNHTRRVFVEHVDVVSGVGYDHARAAGPAAERYHRLHRVVTNLGVFDFETPDRRMRLRSVHHGASVAAVVDHTDFDLHVPDDVPRTRVPTPDELDLLRGRLDRRRARDLELSDGPSAHGRR